MSQIFRQTPEGGNGWNDLVQANLPTPTPVMICQDQDQPSEAVKKEPKSLKERLEERGIEVVNMKPSITEEKPTNKIQNKGRKI